MEHIENQQNNTKDKPTIPEISAALLDVFNWKDIKSQEMMNWIKEIYFLMDLIIRYAPNNLKSLLFLWPTNENQIPEFVEYLKQEYTDWIIYKDILNEILNFYLSFFERWGEDRINQRRKIVRNYNPDKINEIKKLQFKGSKLEAAWNETLKKYHPERFLDTL